MNLDRERIEALKDLSSLLDRDLITKEEFEGQKNRIFQENVWHENLLQDISLFVRLFTPQFVTLIIVCLFYFPISRIITNASEVAFGDNFSFKVQQALRIGDPELASTVKKLSKGEIVTLISTESGKSLYSTSSVSEDEPIVLDDRINYYSSLQEKGLIYSNVDLEEIMKMVNSKVPSEELQVSDEIRGNFMRKYYPSASFTEEELEQIRQTFVFLTPSGQRVYWLILDTAAEELTTLN